jgi:RNA polymerase sigma factor (sigma-70 family)
VAFSTYAYRCIETTIAGALRREADRQIDCISLSLLIGEEDDNPLEDLVADKQADAALAALNTCEREQIEEALAGLPEQQARLVRAIYFEGDSIVQVAASWGLNPQAVQNIHVKALKALRVRLKRLGMRRPEG